MKFIQLLAFLALSFCSVNALDATSKQVRRQLPDKEEEAAPSPPPDNVFHAEAATNRAVVSIVTAESSALANHLVICAIVKLIDVAAEQLASAIAVVGDSEGFSRKLASSSKDTLQGAHDTVGGFASSIVALDILLLCISDFIDGALEKLQEQLEEDPENGILKDSIAALEVAAGDIDDAQDSNSAFLAALAFLKDELYEAICQIEAAIATSSTLAYTTYLGSSARAIESAQEAAGAAEGAAEDVVVDVQAAQGAIIAAEDQLNTLLDSY